MSVRGKASKYRGVYKCGRKWKSQIQVDGVQHYLGIFENEVQAAAKYNEAAAGLGRAENILDNESSYPSVTSRENILFMDTIIAPETESHIIYPQLHGRVTTSKVDSDSESILQLLTTMDSADDNDGDDDEDEVYVAHRSPTITPRITNASNRPVEEFKDRVMIGKKITLGKLIQKISSILELVKQSNPDREGSSSNGLHWKQHGDTLSRKAFLWSTLEDFRLLTAEKMKLVEELL